MRSGFLRKYHEVQGTKNNPKMGKYPLSACEVKCMRSKCDVQWFRERRVLYPKHSFYEDEKSGQSNNLSLVDVAFKHVCTPQSPRADRVWTGNHRWRKCIRVLCRDVIGRKEAKK
jgi:hypothetical protein